MKIKTLAEILAESDTDSASNAVSKPKSRQQNKYTSSPEKKPNEKSVRKIDQHPSKLSKNDSLSTHTDLVDTDFVANSASTDTLITTKKASKSTNLKPKKRKKRFHPAAVFQPESSDAPIYQPPEPQSIKEILAEVKHEVHDNTSADIEDNNDLEADNLPSALKAYLRTPEQKQAEIDAIKAESRLRWLAFYYLSRREHSKAELKQKLIDKEQDPDKIDALLDEFEEKGYQSDYRTTLMLIRENIRKGRGRARIKQEFYHKNIAIPSNIDELIDMANAESDEFIEFVADEEDSLIEGVDWLKLAVTARTKKYGDTLPKDQKDKARQLRFLQYRGFKTDICFQALNYTLDTLDERF